MKGERLGEFEEVVLLSARIEGEASGIAIQQVLEREASRDVSLGAIYSALDRLARKGLVDSWLGDPTPVRGGRRKRYYQVTPEGLLHLEETRRIRDALWEKAERIRLDQSAVR